MNRVVRKYFPILMLILLLYKRYNILNKVMIPKYRYNIMRRLSDFSRLRSVAADVDAILAGSDEKIQEHLKINANTFKKILDLMKLIDRGADKRYELMVFMYWMGTGCDFKPAACFFGLSCLSVKSITHKMLDYFVINMRGSIKPPSDEQHPEISSKFCKRSKTEIFNRAIGAIGTCHIRIKCPENRYDEYINNENFYSIKCQAVVDSNYIFNDLFVGFAGSIDDLWIFKNSSLHQSGSYTKNNTYLLGDNGYRCQLGPVAVITPYKNPTEQQKLFNAVHNKAQNVVQYAFGLVKMRWKKIFNHELEMKVSHCCKLVLAACVIHNICVSVDDMGPILQVTNIMENYVSVNETNDTEEEEDDSPDGIIFRNNLMEQLI